LSSDKKDLTRIEDLAEYLHEIEEESASAEDGLPVMEDEETSTELPELPPEDQVTFEADAFADSTEENLDFTSSTENGPENFESNDIFQTTEEETEPFTLSEEEPITETATEDFKLEDFEDRPEEIITQTLPEPRPESVSTFKSPENFEDIKKFSESSTFSGVGAEGNPSFSLLIKNVRYIEDVNDILIMLKELGLIADSEEQMRARLMRGSLLVPRISEFAAIYVAHKLRRFDVDIQVGLSDDIHPPKHQEIPETGMVSKSNLYQNQTHHFNFNDPKLELSHIIISATQGLEGYQVVRYLGVASEHKMLDSYIVEDENSSDIPRHYQELAQKLRAHALKAQSNAVVGINYQLTPIPSEIGISGHKYRLSCTGNLVWVNKL